MDKNIYKNHYDELKIIAEKAILQQIKSIKCSSQKLLDAMEYSLLNGGKRLRPVLMLAVSELFSKDYTPVLPLACAIEMIHTYSLIHDDLPAMDNDDLRRGKPSNHKVFGEDMAILAGDGLLNLAYETMIKGAFKQDDIASYLKAMNIIALCAGSAGMIEGQALDINISANSSADVSMEQVEYIEQKKTGELIVASVLAAGYCHKASINQIASLKEFAKSVGQAFQIVDDILDNTSTEEELGKSIGKDARDNKPTYVQIFGIKSAKEKAHQLTNLACEHLSVFDNSEFLQELTNELVLRKF